MAHSNKTIALLLGSLFTLAACSGGAAGSDERPAASAADSGAGSTAPSAPPPATPGAVRTAQTVATRRRGRRSADREALQG